MCVCLCVPFTYIVAPSTRTKIMSDTQIYRQTHRQTQKAPITVTERIRKTIYTSTRLSGHPYEPKMS